MTHTDQSRELLPCPFCGGSTARATDFEESAIHVVCKCGVSLYGGREHFGSIEAAVNAWNRRNYAIASNPDGTASAEAGLRDCGTPTTEQSSGVELPEPQWHNPSPMDAAHFPYYTPEQVRALLAGAHESRREAQRQLETIQGELAKLERYQFMLNRGALVPPGFKSVPVEPTEEMFLDGMEASCVARPSVDDDSYVRSIWNAMLAAAPQPPKDQT